ncbi:hypothetical protein GCM10027258_66330 [Amycolatopsis stemonae]
MTDGFPQDFTPARPPLLAPGRHRRSGPGLTVTVRSMGTEGNRAPQELA